MKLRPILVLAPALVSISIGLAGCDDETTSGEDGGAAGDRAAGGTSDGGSPAGGGGPSGGGTGGTDDGLGGGAGESPELPPRLSVDEFTNVSADNYAHNRFGLIEAATLEAYASSWDTVDSAAASAVPNGRPAYLASDARLIVLQLNAANRAAGEDYIPTDADSGVYTFEIDAFRFNETRDTGLVENSVRYQASGETTDAWLEKYGIDLSRDFVVFAAGSNALTTGAFFQDLGRAIYWLQYWGADIEHLGIVNGTLAQNYTGTLSSSELADGAISNDGFSVKELRVDGTALTVPLEDFLEIVDEELEAEDVIDGYDEQFIIDARPTAQFNRTTGTASFNGTHPGQFITTAWNSSGAPSNDATGQAKTYVPVEGHVKGAVSFPWAALLVDVGSNNWKYKPKADLATLFQTAGYAPGDAADKVIVSQCRTNFEVQVNGFAARIILGYPTAHFDGSLVEYFSLVSGHPTSSFNLEPSDPAYQYRTDIPTRAQHYTASANAEAPSTTENDAGVAAYNVPSGTGPSDRKVTQAVLNPNATTTRLALDADREYKRIETD